MNFARSSRYLAALRRIHTCSLALTLLLIVFCLAPLPSFAQAQPAGKSVFVQPAAKTPASPAKRSPAYLSDNDLTFLDILPPFPVPGTEQDAADVATLKLWQRPIDSARWKLAFADATVDFSRFNEVYGSPLDAAHAPLLNHLLTQVQRDVGTATGKAKHFYHRQRPFERLGFPHVCWEKNSYQPPLKGDDMSYPSGHNSFAWSTVLTLAAVAPERQQQLLARGVEYGESRMVCGVHYPSDVQGGKLIATAVFEKLQTNALFQRDLRCAKEEHAISNNAQKSLDAECQQLLATVKQR